MHLSVTYVVSVFLNHCQSPDPHCGRVTKCKHNHPHSAERQTARAPMRMRPARHHPAQPERMADRLVRRRRRRRLCRRRRFNMFAANVAQSVGYDGFEGAHRAPVRCCRATERPHQPNEHAYESVAQRSPRVRTIINTKRTTHSKQLRAAGV